MSGKETAVGGILIMGFSMWAAEIILVGLIGIALGFIILGLLVVAFVVTMIGLIVTAVRGEHQHSSRVVLGWILGLVIGSSLVTLWVKNSHPSVPQPGGGPLLVFFALLGLYVWMGCNAFVAVFEYWDDREVTSTGLSSIISFALLTSALIGYWGAPVH